MGHRMGDREFVGFVATGFCDLRRVPTSDADNIIGNFSNEESLAALQNLKPGKAPSPDAICPELIMHAGTVSKFWLRSFLASCLELLKIPKICRRAPIVVIP